MRTTFLGQGFESESVNAIGNYIIKYLNEEAFHSFTGISAFASEAGIFGLAGHIKTAKANFQNLTIIVGIDQEGTSKEALLEILNLDIEGYIFYQSESPIFHPKLYLFEGEQQIKVIIGSSNLTGRGLFANVESSLLIEFDINDTEGKRLLTEIKTYYKSLFDFSDCNLFKISNETIDNFIAKGIVPNEATRKSFYNRKTQVSEMSERTQNTNNIIIPKRKTSKIPASFPSKTQRKSVSKKVGEEIRLDTPDIYSVEQLVWKSGPLTQRDLNIPRGTNTNPTGSMLFKKGEMKDIDQRHYFRDFAFGSLPWVFDTGSGKTHLERATAFFKIIIDEIDYGIFPLSLTHNTKTDTPSYKQKNSMTQVSWGNATKLIAKESLIGKTASLYKSDIPNQFTLEIK